MLKVLACRGSSESFNVEAKGPPGPQRLELFATRDSLGNVSMSLHVGDDLVYDATNGTRGTLAGGRYRFDGAAEVHRDQQKTGERESVRVEATCP